MDPALTALTAALVVLVAVVSATALLTAATTARTLHLITEQQRSQRIADIIGPARRLALELDVPSHGGLPRWGFANVDPTHEQVDLFVDDTVGLVNVVRTRLLDCACTHPDATVRAAAATVAVRANSAWTSTVARLRGEIAARATGDGPAEGDRAVTMSRRYAEEVEHLADLLTQHPW